MQKSIGAELGSEFRSRPRSSSNRPTLIGSPASSVHNKLNPKYVDLLRQHFLMCEKMEITDLRRPFQSGILNPKGFNFK